MSTEPALVALTSYSITLTLGSSRMLAMSLINGPVFMMLQKTRIYILTHCISNTTVMNVYSMER